MQSRSPRALRFVHTSDIHLESDTFGAGEAGDRIRERIRRAFSNVIELANERADLLLIVGDLFDSSPVSEDSLQFALSEIGRARVPVVMVPGNHDAHDERSIYAALNPGILPANLHLILEPEGRTVEFPDLDAHLWGRALVEHSPEYRPLSGIVPPRPGMWNIALAHGLFVEDSRTIRSSPIGADEIEASSYHYIALGHLHVFSDVSQGATRAIYCGTPAPLHDSDDTGWVAYVRCLPEEGVVVEPLVISA